MMKLHKFIFQYEDIVSAVRNKAYIELGVKKQNRCSSALKRYYLNVGESDP